MVVIGEDENVVLDEKDRVQGRGFRGRTQKLQTLYPKPCTFFYTALVTLTTKKVYLHTLADDILPLRYSVNTLRRAAQMQRFLKELMLATNISGRLELLVLNRSDWYNLSSFHYGLPLSKTKKDPETNLFNATLFVAADYPPRLIQRFNDPLLKAAKEGYKAPGEPRELLDLLAGCEWAHVLHLVNQKHSANQEQSDEKWQDEIRAVAGFTRALKKAGHDFLLGQFKTWAGVQKAGGDEADLTEFTYPRCKMRFTTMLYLQGSLALEAL